MTQDIQAALNRLRAMRPGMELTTMHLNPEVSAQHTRALYNTLPSDFGVPSCQDIAAKYRIPLHVPDTLDEYDLGIAIATLEAALIGKPRYYVDIRRAFGRVQADGPVDDEAIARAIALSNVELVGEGV